jgi:hypothetical protein
MHTAGDTRRTRALSTTTDTSRRRLFATAASALAAGAALATAAQGAPITEAAGAGPDAPLIGICAEFCECERTFRVIYDDPARETDDDEAWVAGAPVMARIESLSRAILGCRARTAAGITAVALALAVHGGTGAFSLDPSTEYVTGRLSLTLMRETLRLHGLPVPDELLEVAAVSAAAVPAPRNRDAQLIEVCNAFLAAEGDVQAINSSDDYDEEAVGIATDRWYAALERLTTLPALTLDGMRAKAKAAHIALLSIEGPDGLQREEAAALSVLADLMGRAAA